MNAASRIRTALFAVTFAAVAACAPETLTIAPSPAVASASAAPSATPTRTASLVPTASLNTGPSAPATASTAPGSTPNAACPPQSGGSPANRSVVTAVRVAHNPGFDRVVFELGPNSVGAYGLPPYTIDVASGFTATSGQPVRVDGNAFFLVRLSNTDAHDASGRVTLASTDVKATTPLVKEVRLVEDFEAVNRWAVGLDHLGCPSVLTLTNPVRVVVDFPTPP